MTNKYVARNSMLLLIRQKQSKTTKRTIIYILVLINLKDWQYQLMVRLRSNENSYPLQVGVNIGLLLVILKNRLFSIN